MHREESGPEDYLRLPYTHILIPDEESGTFTAEIIEFPGCIAQGDTPEEAYARLEETAKAWIEAALDLGQKIPLPLTVQGYGGKYALRLPKGLHRQASLAAEREGTSLNQFIISAISEKLGASNLYHKLTQTLMQKIVAQEFFIGQYAAYNEKVREIGYDISDTADNIFGKAGITPTYAISFIQEIEGEDYHA